MDHAVRHIGFGRIVDSLRYQGAVSRPPCCFTHCELGFKITFTPSLFFTIFESFVPIAKGKAMADQLMSAHLPSPQGPIYYLAGHPRWLRQCDAR